MKKVRQEYQFSIRQIIAMAGSFLPIQLIYHGKIPLSQSKYNFPKEFYVTQISTHWTHEEASIAFLEHVLSPILNLKVKSWIPVVSGF